MRAVDPRSITAEMDLLVPYNEKELTMSGSSKCLYIATTLALLLSAVASAQDQLTSDDWYLTSVKVSGTWTANQPRSLSIDFVSQDAPELFDAVLIRTSPSQTVLFMHSDSTRSIDKPEPTSSTDFIAIPRAINAQIGTPIARVSGPVVEFTHQITLPEIPEIAEDMMISVSVLLDGVEYAVVSTTMPEEGAFSFSSDLPFSKIIGIEDFDESQRSITTKIRCENGQFNCCSGGTCGQMCACCKDLTLDCNIVTCTISCDPPDGCI
jgi:hypothetical protein